MTENFDLQKHIANGVEKIVTDALKATLKNPKESAFMVKFAAASKKASKRRMQLEEEGDHAPGFLIASVTSSCNLHCAGCYSRCIETTTDEAPVCQLSGKEWLDIFCQARDLGISFILVAGGEPLLRRDIIEAASTVKEILFPIFTNGTYIDDAYFSLFDSCRNLVPVLSIEGGRDATDQRRGEGMYDVVLNNMKAFREKQILFGASITVTTENLQEVTSPSYVEFLVEHGCKMILFIEFVPVTEEAKDLAPGGPEREYLDKAMEALREQYPDLLLLSFPGDELKMGGCMAAGREFFHINSHGGAEPCPFSPFSDINIRETSLREALNSNLFVKLREGGHLLDDHKGGCVLYEKRDLVQSLLGSK
ncbi:MAG: radical SAM protein [Parasporobacterium sp.]|nr:radical SAM protein [Parasporobacterium sp.]